MTKHVVHSFHFSQTSWELWFLHNFKVKCYSMVCVSMCPIVTWRFFFCDLVHRNHSTSFWISLKENFDDYSGCLWKEAKLRTSYSNMFPMSLRNWLFSPWISFEFVKAYSSFPLQSQTNFWKVTDLAISHHSSVRKKQHTEETAESSTWERNIQNCPKVYCNGPK